MRSESWKCTQITQRAEDCSCVSPTTRKPQAWWASVRSRAHSSVLSPHSTTQAGRHRWPTGSVERYVAFFIPWKTCCLNFKMLIQVSQQDCCFSYKPRTGLPLAPPSLGLWQSPAAAKPPLQRIPIFLDLNRSGVLSSGCAQKVPDILNFVTGGTEVAGREDTLLHFFLKK